MINPELSTIFFSFIYSTNLLITIAVTKPAPNPIAKHAPIFYINPAPAPDITPPITVPNEAYRTPTFSPLAIKDPQ